MRHIPVLQKEVLKYLDPKPNENFIDGTIGGAGHARAILEKIKPDGKVLGIDLDEKAIEGINDQNSKLENLILVNDSYADLKKIVESEKFGPVSGILLDLGISSFQIDESGRGFSFRKDEILDMRFGIEKSGLTAEKVVNDYSEEKIERILREYGEEKFSKKIARKIAEERKIKPIKSALRLAEIVKKAAPGIYRGQKIHPATRTFQAIRIEVNGELDNLRKVLPQSLEVLEKGARIVVISFHSLEDRIVKNFFKEFSGARLEILTKNPITPDSEELKNNIRARSAKLRAAKII